MTIHASMAEALRLTRSGHLLQATATLRSALQGTAPTKDVRSDPTDLKPAPSRPLPKLTASTGAGAIGRTTAGSTFEECTFQGDARALRYRLYVPADVTGGMPLIVMLHGCTQSPEDFARGTAMNRLADEFGFLVAYPQQTRAANTHKCWNWFKPGDQQRDRGEPALLAGVTRQVVRAYDVDPTRVYIAGLSAGGAAAAIMAAEYPDLYAAVGIHSGLACGAAKDLPTALAAMKRGGGAASAKRTHRGFVPSIIFHGERDTTVHEVNSHEIAAAAARARGVSLDVRIEEGRSGTGRRYRRELSCDRDGTVFIERWAIEGAGHAWSGGDASGSYTDPEGPQASREMVRFFLERTLEERPLERR